MHTHLTPPSLPLAPPPLPPQAVEAPTLSIMVPLLVRGLRHDNTTAIKRKASVIIENMAKLVDNPLDAGAHLK